MVVPTYDEVANLERLVERLHAAQPGVDVLVVDDGSPDGTGDLADRLAAEDPRVQVLHRSRKEGLGAAYLHGFTVALERGYDVIGEMDADGSHQPEQLHLLLEALADADLVIGSRYVHGGRIVNWSRGRELLSRGGNLYTRALLGIQVRDATAGYRLFRRATLERLHLDEIESAGYVFQADLAFRTVRAGLRVVEVPIEFVEREHGESKMTGRVAAESLRRITGGGSASAGARCVTPSAGGGARPPRNRAVLPGVDPGMRKRFPWWVLVVAFVVVPLVEIYVIIQIGQVIGAWWTIALLIADSFLGSWLVKREGARAWVALSTALEEGRMPATELADGVLVLVGGLLMLTPGFVLDIAGALCILPFTRPVGRRMLTRVISRRLVGASFVSYAGPRDPPDTTTPRRSR